MPWEGKRQLPHDWKRRRRRVLERDGYRCRVCGAPANQVDHIVPNDDHSLSNLQSLCDVHHRVKTHAEAAAARAARPKRVRPSEPHPGLL